ncbi:MAG TPA: TlpA disulfide reductase family protein [Pyrinomonadaceae bacterium]|nr:TlpA disulfide reductase family protein [Pyrinomonadaceae bacterium]
MKHFFAVFVVFAFVFSVFAQKKTEKKNENLLATDLKAATIDGKIVNTADLRGKVIVLNLWFINCPNCLQEIKMLNEIVDEYKGKDVVFLGLATNNKTELQRFVKKNPFKYQIIPDVAAFMLTNYGDQKNGVYNLGFPTHVVIDREGYIVMKMQGIKGVDAVKKELKNQFEKKETKSK